MIKSSVLCLLILVSCQLARSSQQPQSPPLPLCSGLTGLWNLSRVEVKRFEHGIEGLERGRPLIIAHRGYSGVLPEQTREAYRAAVVAGADVLECDAALSKDNRVVCLHETWMSDTTDVASKFPASRADSHKVGDQTVHDFFSVDFSLQELRTLGKVQANEYRDQRYNGFFEIATLQDMIQIAMEANRTVGIHVELKDPKFHNEHVTGNLSFEQLVVKVMLDNGCEDRSNFRCFVQSFSKESLRVARKLTKLPLVYLTEFMDSLQNEELDELSTWVYGVGPWKEQIVNAAGTTDLIERCHERGLKVHAYTFRNEFQHLPTSARQDPYLEMAVFFKLSLDAFFTDFPETANYFLNALYAYY